jgi:hypothetical protein
MTNQDQEWIDSLAGKTTSKTKSVLHLEAAAVRRALLARRESIEKESLNFNAEQLELIRKKLVDVGLIQNQQLKKSSLIINFLIGIVSIKSGQAVAQRVGVIAVILLIGFAIRSSYIENKKDDSIIYRGDSIETYIFDEKPDERLSNLLAGLTALNADFSTEKLSYGKTLIKIKSTEEVTAFLVDRRINPKEFNGYISLVISPPRVQNN